MNEPLRVLHLNSGNLYGGVETFLLTLAECRELVPRMQPEFGLCFGGRAEDELRASGCPVHRLGEVRFSRPWTVWRARRNLKSLMEARSMDVVVCHQPWIQALFGNVVTKSHRTYVAYYHNHFSGGGWTDRKARSTKPHLVAAPSQSTLDSTNGLFPGAARAVIHNPLSKRILEEKSLTVTERNERRTAMNLAANDVVIFQASRVEAWKGPDLVIEALSQLRNVPGWQFLYAGAPQRPHEHELFDTMKRIATESGIGDRVRFLGARTDVPELMQLVDIYTQGNREIEGFGLSYLEAAYNSVPIITTTPGALGEMVDDTNGIVVRPNDVPALAEAFRTLIGDPQQRQALGAGGRAKALRQCDPHRQLSRMADLFHIAKAPR